MSPQAKSIYDDTINLLKDLDDNQLQAVHSVIAQFSLANSWNSPLKISTEEELWSHIEHSLSQAKAGEGTDADELIDSLMKEYAN